MDDDVQKGRDAYKQGDGNANLGTNGASGYAAEKAAEEAAKTSIWKY